uniref:Uncharacterized protein n=1 Tax=Panagrolaimus sp. ES5 TaxID=591445 RepID=A0AC34GWR4_9BILA
MGTFKCWINGSINIFNFEKPNIASNLIAKIYRCDATYLNLNDQNLLFNEFLFFASSVQTCSLNKVKIQYPNGEEVFLEDIIKPLTKLQRFYSFSKPHISLNTVKNLLNIPHFSRLSDFNLKNLDEDFDIQIFYNYFTTNQFTKICLHFGNAISDEFKDELETIVDEIIDVGYLAYQPPLITYPQMSFQRHQNIMAVIRKKSLLK